MGRRDGPYVETSKITLAGPPNRLNGSFYRGPHGPQTPVFRVDGEGPSAFPHVKVTVENVCLSKATLRDPEQTRALRFSLLPTGPPRSPPPHRDQSWSAGSLARRAPQKTVLELDALRTVVLAIPADLRGLRDRALLLIGWAVALRRSELVALEFGDLSFEPEGGVNC